MTEIDTESRGDPQAKRWAPKWTPPQVIAAFIVLAVLITVLAVIVHLSGKSGPSIRPRPALPTPSNHYVTP